MKPNVTSIAEVAREQSCSRQAVYNAIERGDLTAVQVGRVRMIAKDQKYAAFQVKETGGRLHKAYRDRQGG